jgi:hypothetical protein
VIRDDASEPAQDDGFRSSLVLMGLPFLVEDELAEPFSSFFVVRIMFETPVLQETMGDLDRVLQEWVLANARTAQQAGQDEPEGETVQAGEQTVEFQIRGATGDPDSALPSMLHRLAELSRSRQRILRVEMD